MGLLAQNTRRCLERRDVEEALLQSYTSTRAEGSAPDPLQVLGGLGCEVFDVDRGVVGASGACYAILGGHVAVLAMHWRRSRRGLFTRGVSWRRGIE